MTLRQYTALALGAVAAWLLWQGIEVVMILTSRGSPLSDALLEPPTSLWRILAALIALDGAVLAALRIRFGAVLALIGSLLFAALGLVLMLMGTDVSIWLDEVIFGAVMVLLSGVLLALKRS
ncbi:hypothetical protein [Hyphomonas sp.]|uniref:hypothetical protein n=1 Tax=Hyphomonas sp. TaxID=87 RepID=UPI003919DF2D